MIRFTRSVALAAIVLTVLGGCTTRSLEKLRHVEPQGSAFQKFLSKNYLDFAESEAKDYDWYAQQHFSEKGLTLAYGNDIEPDLVSQWNIPDSMHPELEKARASLMNVLTTINKTDRPEVTARAQYSYDCWLEQQEENWQADDIDSCRQNFYQSISQLDGPPEPKDEPQPVAKKDEPLVLSTSYIVFFELNSATLTPEGHKIIKDVVKDIKNGKDPYEIVLNGHTDRSGSDDYNMKLSEKRVEAVRTALLAGGVTEKAISIYAFGETDNRVTTNDNAKEKANRRVEIFLNQEEPASKEDADAGTPQPAEAQEAMTPGTLPETALPKESALAPMPNMDELIPTAGQ